MRPKVTAATLPKMSWGPVAADELLAVTDIPWSWGRLVAVAESRLTLK